MPVFHPPAHCHASVPSTSPLSSVSCCLKKEEHSEGRLFLSLACRLLCSHSLPSFQAISGSVEVQRRKDTASQGSSFQWVTSDPIGCLVPISVQVFQNPLDRSLRFISLVGMLEKTNLVQDTFHFSLTSYICQGRVFRNYYSLVVTFGGFKQYFFFSNVYCDKV
uniref:Uncharacterized protein n=1 Tax=Sphaerodactylus townsendi TaxID=933632 RepID=A0ACB8FQS5_9SAUR